MNGDYGTTVFVMDSGERDCLVIDKATGLPVFHPKLFLPFLPIVLLLMSDKTCLIC